MTRTNKSMIVLISIAILIFGAVSAQAACTPGTPTVIIWHAGSLSNAFKAVENLFTAQGAPGYGVCVQDKSAGSVDIMRQVTAGGQAADIVAPADYLDIDIFLKPAGYANYNIQFTQSKMVLAFLASKIAAKGIPVPTPDDWYTIVTNPNLNVTIGGSHLYLDPSGYRAPMIFLLAQDYYNVPNLYNNLLEHYVAAPAQGATTPYALGTNYDFSLTYESNAIATAATNSDYQYIELPDAINLGNSSNNKVYKKAVIVMPDLNGTGLVPVPGSRVTWGITILKKAPNPDNALKFVQFLLSDAGAQKAMADNHFPLLSPSLVGPLDYLFLPKVLRPYVQVEFGQ